MSDHVMEALVVLVRERLPQLDLETRRQYLRKLRDRWCEGCGHTEGYTCTCPSPDRAGPEIPEYHP